MTWVTESQSFRTKLRQLLRPNPELGDVHAEVEPVGHAHDEARHVTGEGSTATRTGGHEGRGAEGLGTDAAAHGENEHGGTVA